MRTVIFILSVIISTCSFAQEKSIKTSTIHVSGNCGECKERIENAADIKGVKIAQWNAKTNFLIITFREDKVSELQIKQAILDAGHDIDSLKADDAIYAKLPSCCKYRSKKCEK
ncbi:MAG: heavy-metal-associated domain-containing protein [Bacteroidota bacterium]